MALLSRLTAHIARLTTPVSLLTAPSPCWLLLAGREIRGSWPGPCGFLGGSSRGVIMGPRGPRAIVACGRTMLKSSTPRCTAVLWSGLASRLLTGAGRVAPPRPRTGPRRPAGAPRGVARVSAHCCLRAGGGCRFVTIRDYVRQYVHPPQHETAGHAGVRYTKHSSFPKLAPPLLTTLERPPRGPHSGAARSGASRSGASFPPRAAPHTSPGARGAGRLETDTYSRCDTHTRGSWAVYRASKGLR